MALGVHDMLRNTLPIEVRHFLQQVVILEEERSLGASREGELVTRCPNARISGRKWNRVVVIHGEGGNTHS